METRGEYERTFLPWFTELLLLNLPSSVRLILAELPPGTVASVPNNLTFSEFSKVFEDIFADGRFSVLVGVDKLATKLPPNLVHNLFLVKVV